MNYDELFPGRFLKSGQFKGRDVTLTIRSVRIEPLPDDKGGTKVKGIVGFEKTPLELVLNRTNGECFKALWGKETDVWIGKRVTLWPAPFHDNMTGEDTTCIRVRGSPDIAATVTFELKLARKKPARMTLLKTGAKASTTTSTAVPVPVPVNEPGLDFEPPTPEEVAAAEAAQSGGLPP